MQALAESLRDLIGRQTPAGQARLHLDATMAWLARAQDVTGSGGVARMFHLRHGWGAAYPETTGYLIPTFIHYARLTGDVPFTKRALYAADWEIEVQMADGAVQGGTIDQLPASPAVFNTGQVLFGWCAAYNETREARFMAAAHRAAEWLCVHQDDDGLWRRHLSRFCSAATDTYAYNARSAWALLRYAEISGKSAARHCGERNLNAVVQLAQANGWVAKNCLNDPRRPLLHTIAYTQQGLLEGGLLANHQQAIDVAVEGSIQLRRQFGEHGSLAGRYDCEWHPVARWRCLTGEAQTAIVWYRLADWTGDSAWREAADKLVDAVCATQRLDGPPGVAGGVKGSYPIWGEYGQYEYLNWAGKFLADALMLKLGYKAGGSAG